MGERIELSPPADPVTRTFAISFEDGCRYAWTGQGEDGGTGERVLSLRFDPHQSVVREELVHHQDVHFLTRTRRSDSDLP